MRWLGLSICALISLVTVPKTLAEIVASPSSTASFVENFDNTPAVSGSALMGLSLGIPTGRVDLDKIMLTPTSDTASIVCVRAATQDGRFSSSNPYQLRPAGQSAGQPGSSFVRLLSLTRKYKKELIQYPADSLAIRAFEGHGQNCGPKGAVHLPQIPPGNVQTRLIVLVNSSSRYTTATLKKDLAILSKAECTSPSGGAQVAFDRVCDLDRNAAGESGVYTVEVVLDDGFGAESFSVDVRLPRLP